MIRYNILGVVMKTIEKNVQNEIIIKNSRFLTFLYPMEDLSFSIILNQLKQNYPKATHYCYAYIYEDEKGCSDDGEPSRTAGVPMLNVLEKENLHHILAVTIRYFGGIKLGAGGLVRAYTKSITEALKLANFIELIEAYQIKISFDYKDERQLFYLLGESHVLEKNYSSIPSLLAVIPKDKISALHSYPYEIIKECYIKKDSR